MRKNCPGILQTIEPLVNDFMTRESEAGKKRFSRFVEEIGGAASFV